MTAPTRWTPAPRTPLARQLLEAAAARVGSDPTSQLDVDAVLARALKGEDPAVLGEDDWSEGLGRYLASALEDGRLNALGVLGAANAAVGRLRARRSIAATAARLDAEAGPGTAFGSVPVFERELLPPIVIIGGWRTGTTFLFRLLAADPRLRAPLPPELVAPWRFATLDGAEREAAIDAGAAAHDGLAALNPQLHVIHPSGARLAEECVLAMGTDFRNWGFTSTTRLDGYADWLAGQDFDGAYRRLRQVYQLLDRGDGRRWVLKAPAHTANVDALAAAFPGATVVHLHRDVVETVTSGASLFATFRSTYSDEVDPVDVGAYQAETTLRWFTRAAEARDRLASAPTGNGAPPSPTFVDLDYRSLVADPDAAVARIYEAAGMGMSDEARAALDAHRRADAEQRATGPSHRYTPEEFGLDPDDLRRRFADYTARFLPA